MSKIRGGAITPIISKRRAKNVYNLGSMGYIEKICERRGGVFYILSEDTRISGKVIKTVTLDSCPYSILARVDADMIRLGGDIIYEIMNLTKQHLGFVFCSESAPGCILCTVYLLDEEYESLLNVNDSMVADPVLYIPFPCYDRKCYSKNGGLVCETSVEGQRVGQNARFSDGMEKLEKCEMSLRELSLQIRQIMNAARSEAFSIGERADSKDGIVRCEAISAGSILSEKVYTAGLVAGKLENTGEVLKKLSKTFDL